MNISMKASAKLAILMLSRNWQLSGYDGASRKIQQYNTGQRTPALRLALLPYKRQLKGFELWGRRER